MAAKAEEEEVGKNKKNDWQTTVDSTLLKAAARCYFAFFFVTSSVRIFICLVTFMLPTFFSQHTNIYNGL